MTIGIQAIGVYIPPDVVDNLARTETFNTDRDFVLEKLGFQTLSRKSGDQNTSDLCVQAFKNLAWQCDISGQRIDCLIVCTQNPDGFGLPHTSAIVQGKLGLPDTVAAFDISLGCSGYVYGLSIAQAFMQVNDLHNCLFFTADPYSKILDSGDRNTELLFGDGATCTLLSKQPRYHLLKTIFATDGLGHGAIIRDHRTGFLVMQGQKVFMFAMKKVPEQVSKCLANNHLTKEDIDIFLFHQGSRYIVENLQSRLGIPPDKVPFSAKYTGNTVSSSIPMLLQEHIALDTPRILLSGFGVGLSWATTIIEQFSKTKEYCMISNSKFMSILLEALKVITKENSDPIGEDELFEDYGLDSLDRMNLLLELEDRLKSDLGDLDLSIANTPNLLYTEINKIQ